jgi:ubiquinone biosynthesis protein Coq4
LFGIDWSRHWATPLVEVRERLRLSGEPVLGEGIRAAA